MRVLSQRWLFLVLVAFASVHARAEGIGVRLAGSALLGGFSSSDMSSNSSFMYEAEVGWAGKSDLSTAYSLVYSGFQASQTASSSTTNDVVSLIGGRVSIKPKFLKNIELGVGYFPSVALTETTSTTSTYRVGSMGYSIEGGWDVKFAAKWGAQIKLTYYSISCDTKTVSSVTTNESYTRTFMYPIAAIYWGF